MYFCNLFIFLLRSDLYVVSYIDMNKLVILFYLKYFEYMSSSQGGGSNLFFWSYSLQ